MGSLAASTVVTADSAGGIALQVWALSRADMDRGQAAARIVALLAFNYAIYLGAIVTFGALLWLGVLPGRAPTALTLVPAVMALAVLGLAAVIARRPARMEQRLESSSVVRAVLRAWPADC